MSQVKKGTRLANSRIVWYSKTLTMKGVVMKRRDFLKAAGAGVLLSSLGCAVPLRSAARRKPNIILCMADDQGWGNMGYYGHPNL